MGTPIFKCDLAIRYSPAIFHVMHTKYLEKSSTKLTN